MHMKSIPLCLTICLLFAGVAIPAQEEVSRKVASEKVIGEVGSSRMFHKSFRVSPDSRRVTYITRAGNKSVVVVDGKKEKEYYLIEPRSLVFSPDSQRVAYAARVDRRKEFAVVDGEEGKQYDGIVALGGGRIVFDSPDSFYYLGRRGDKIYLVQETLK